MKQFPIISLLIAAVCLLACEEQYSPKSRAHFRIDMPEKDYEQYSSEDCPFQFMKPVYAEVYPDTSTDAGYCWKNIKYIPFNAYLHLSYKTVLNEERLHELMEDARTFVYKHTVKADQIQERSFKIGDHTGGVFYELGGNTASALQFFMTDSTDHYLRGALYFMAETDRDSLDPVIEFIKEDLLVLINSFDWKDAYEE
jgi:gliding motility-associated lipoprotein GldD